MTLDPKYDDYDYPTTSPNSQSGHPGHTTPEQDAQVHQLRTQLEQAGYKERLDTLSLVSIPKYQGGVRKVHNADWFHPDSYGSCERGNSTWISPNKCAYLES